MKKTEQIYGVKTTYITEGEGKDMILLHGWGQNKEQSLTTTKIAIVSLQLIFLALVRVIIHQLLGVYLIMKLS